MSSCSIKINDPFAPAWLRFAGKVASRTKTETVLIPADDPDMRWHLKFDDVKTAADGNGKGNIFLRRDGIVRDFKRVSPAPPLP